MNEVTRDDIERFYAKAAASGVYAPLDPGELDSMEDRLAGRVVWREPKRDTERFITLTVPWSGVVLDATALRGCQVTVEPETLRVVMAGSGAIAGLLIVRSPVYGDVSLLRSA